MKLLWFPDAVSDLDDIYDYYVVRNPCAASVLYNKILDDAQILRTNPRIAPKEPSLEDASREYRSLVVAKGKYKLIYFIL
jgi:plasmid stabilization system protein ParE